MKISKINNSRFIDLLAFLIFILFTSAGILVSLNRYWQYEVFFYDFGIFDQAIWRVSNFQPPIIDHYVVGGKWIFADHFSPGIFLLAPIFWVFKASESLLVLQSLIVGLSGIVLYKIGYDVLKDKLLSFSVLVCYFLFLGLQNAVITDFHEMTIITLPLMLTFWAIIKKKFVLYFIFLLLTLSFKESTFLLGIGIGIFIFFFNRSWLKIALFTILISLIWGFLSIKIIIPHFSGGNYQYYPTLRSNMVDNIYALFDNQTKIRTLFYSFFSFGFLPIFSPAFWFLIIQDFIIRFLPKDLFTRWGLGLHYSAQLSSILALSSLFTLNFLKKIKIFSMVTYFIGILIIVNALYLYQFVLHGPFALAYNSIFYNHSKDFKFLDELTVKIPKNATVMTQNNLATKFTHQNVFLLRENYNNYKIDYILIDKRKGQNPNNLFGLSDIDSIVKNLKDDKNYSLIYKTDEQFLFKRVKQ